MRLAARTDLAPTPYFPSLSRPIRVGGLEREVMVPLVTVILGLLVQLTVPAWALAALLTFGLLPALRHRARREPQMLAVLKGHLAVAGDYRGQGWAGEPRRVRLGTYS